MAAHLPPQAALQMAPQTPLDTPAQAVGNQFVCQYYTVQHTSPKHLHRFYSDASTLTYGDTRPDGFFSKNATGQKTIHDLVMELGFEETSTEVYTVDSQYSLGGGVVVQVTGIMQRPSGPKRPFVQTFFLAVQEKGYYVLNDVFRYLPMVPPTADNGTGAATAASVTVPLPAVLPQSGAAVVAAPAAVVTPGAAPAPAVPVVPLPPPAAAAMQQQQQQQVAMQQFAMQQAATLQSGKANGVAGSTVVQQPVAVQYTAAGFPPGTVPVPLPPAAPVPAPPPPQAMQQQQQQPRQASTQTAVVPPPQQQQQQTAAPSEPLSYAERVRLSAAKAPAPGSPARRQQPPPAAAAEQASHARPSAAAGGEEPSGQQQQQQHYQQQTGGQLQQQAAAAAAAIPVDDHPNASIFVRGIPASVTMTQLVEKLSEYGPLRTDGVVLKTQKGRDSFAFIDFEQSAPAQILLRHGMEIDGARLHVQPKRPLIFRTAARDGRPGVMSSRGGGPGYDAGPAGGPPGGRGDRAVGFRSARGPRTSYPGPPHPQMMDGRPGPGLGPMGPPPGPVPVPMPMPMGPGGPMPPGSMPQSHPSMGPGGRGFGPEGRGYGSGSRGYGGSGRGGRGGRGPPPPQQQQQGPQQAAQQAPQQQQAAPPQQQ